MSPALLQGEAVEQPSQLPGFDEQGLRVLRRSWPPEPPAFESAIVEPEAVVFPAQDLELVVVAVAEDEERIGEGIEVKCLGDESREAVYGMPYEEWKAKHQREASREQTAALDNAAHKH